MFNNSTDDLILEKLTVLYAMNDIEEDITESQLTQIILATETMNYFTLSVLLPKMIESKFITTYVKNDTTLYALTQSGLEVLIYFQNRIPDFFKEKITKYIVENREEILSSHIKKQASYSLQSDSKYVVNLVIIKGRKNVFSINMNVEDELEAKELCRKWNTDYLNKYSKIMDILYEE